MKGMDENSHKWPVLTKLDVLMFKSFFECARSFCQKKKWPNSVDTEFWYRTTNNINAFSISTDNDVLK